MPEIISQDRSIIPACDVSLDLYKRILNETSDLDSISAYKIGFVLGLSYGLPQIVELTKNYTGKPLIYDHQKGGTDTPDLGKSFAKTIKAAGIDAVILVPQAGPDTERVWIESALEEGLGVIVGGMMTHHRYTQSRGGYIANDAVMKIYRNAARLGISDFVVPMNKPETMLMIKDELESMGINPTFYMPGFSSQINNIPSYAGNKWHAIIGRSLYQSSNIRKTALELCSKL